MQKSKKWIWILMTLMLVLLGVAKNATFASAAETEGDTLFRNYFTEDLSNRCNTDYGYQDLVNNIKNQDMIALYEAIDHCQKVFFLSDLSAEIAENGSYYTGCVQAASGLTFDQICQVLAVYRMDHPLYFWISDLVEVSSSNEVNLICFEEYANPQKRTEILEALVVNLQAFEAYLEGSTNNYTVATAAVYQLAQIVDYAYDENGEPEMAAWAHTIAGVVDDAHREVVCEGYAKFYQLLMNYFDVPNVYVVGQANGNTGNTGEMVLHAWNLVQMDDGKYYWTDPTWSDVDFRGHSDSYTPDVLHLEYIEDFPYRVRYVYHLQGDTFYNEHWPLTPDNAGAMYLYPLPVAAEEEYAVEGIGEPAVKVLSNGIIEPIPCDEIIQGEDFNFCVVYNDGLHRYAQILTTNGLTTQLDFPDTITYNGFIYQVVGVNLGAADHTTQMVTIPEGVHYVLGDIRWDNLNPVRVYLPATVEFLSVSFNCLEEIIVAEDNPVIQSVDGVLYSEDGKTLILYPQAASEESYTVPNTVTSIGCSAFLDNLYLSELILQEGLEYIGACAFQRMCALEALDLPGTVKAYGNNILAETNALKSIHISADTYFTCETFQDARGLETIEIDEGNPYGYVFDGAVYQNTTLVYYPCARKAESVTVKEDCTRIEDYAFAYCQEIGTILIPDNCYIQYPELVFYDSRIESLDVSDQNTSFCYQDGAIYNLDKTALHLYLGGCKSESFTVPDSVTIIMNGAFNKNPYVEEITMSDSVTEIRAYAFAECTALKNIRLSDSIAWTVDIVDPIQFYYGIFEGCTSLEEVTLPKASTHVPYWMFHLCSSLKKVVLPENIETIGVNVFVGTHLEELYIHNPDIPLTQAGVGCPAGITEIFVYPYGITDEQEASGGMRTIVYAHPDAVFMDYISNEENRQLVFRDINANAEEQPSSGQCGENAYWSVSGDVLTISGSGEIYDYWGGGIEAPWLWRWGTTIRTVIIEEGITTIGDAAFYGCSALEQVEIPETVTRIGKLAFAACTGLVEMNLPKSIQMIDRSAFNSCTGLEKIVFPEGIRLEYLSFNGCDSLKEVTIPDGVSSLYRVFENCEKLETVFLSKTISMDVRFNRCKTLKAIYVAHDSSAGYLPDLIASFAEYGMKPTIYGCSGTAAEAYCGQYEYPFVDVHGTEYCEYTLDYTPGDINDDGKVNNKDLTRLFQYLSNWEVEVVDEALDVNGDGKVNNKDLTRLFQFLSNWDVEIF